MLSLDFPHVSVAFFLLSVAFFLYSSQEWVRETSCGTSGGSGMVRGWLPSCLVSCSSFASSLHWQIRLSPDWACVIWFVFIQLLGFISALILCHTFKAVKPCKVPRAQDVHKLTALLPVQHSSSVDSTRWGGQWSFFCLWISSCPCTVKEAVPLWGQWWAPNVSELLLLWWTVENCHAGMAKKQLAYEHPESKEFYLVLLSQKYGKGSEHN